MKKKDSISVIVPAFNEEKKLENTILVLLEAVNQQFEQYEIIIVNDGSTDRTGQISERICEKYKHITAINLNTSHCLGGAVKKGFSHAKMDYLTVCHGDGGISSEELLKIWSLRSNTDIVIPYTINSSERPLLSRHISGFFTLILNNIFNLDLKYYMHFAIYKRTNIKQITIKSDSYAYKAEIIIKLLKMGYSYKQIGVYDIFTTTDKTRSYKFKNIYGTFKFLFYTIIDVYYYSNIS